MSRFAVKKSEEDRLESLADPSRFGDLDENDPKSIARWARKMSGELGEDIGPEFDQAVDELESGQMPEGLDGEAGPESGGDFGSGAGAVDAI